MNKINVILINLKSRPNRKIKSLSQLEKVFNKDKIKILDAIDSKEAQKKYYNLDPEAYDNIVNKTYSTCIMPTWGSLGCALSHLEALKWVYKRSKIYQDEYFLIVEDDINIFDEKKFKIKIMQSIFIIDKCRYNGELPDSKLINSTVLNYKESLMIFLSNNNSSNINKKYGTDLYGIKNKFIGTHCYFVNNIACERILNKVYPLLYQIDIQYSYIRNKYNNGNNNHYLNMYNIVNNGIKQSLSKSDVQYHILSLCDILIAFKKLPTEICKIIYDYVKDLEPIRKYKNCYNNQLNNTRSEFTDINFDQRYNYNIYANIYANFY